MNDVVCFKENVSIHASNPLFDVFVNDAYL